MSAEAPKAAVQDLIAKVVGGKALEAFDRYYADDVTMQENEQPPRAGKAACRAFEEDFLSKIKAVREEDMAGLDGRVAVVSGAARGIGLGIAERLSTAGAAVVVAPPRKRAQRR